MVLIHSQDFDLSTNEVIAWLISFNVQFKRINIEQEGIKFISLALQNNAKFSIEFEIDGETISSQNITAYWHRRGGTKLKSEKKDIEFGIEKTFGRKAIKDVKENLLREKQSLVSFINKTFSQIPVAIGNALHGTLNKLAILDLASRTGLSIPETLITTDKNILTNFVSQKDSVITKAILDNLFVHEADRSFMYYTEELDLHKLNDIPSQFYFSLFQTKIEKLYELRIFYLLGKFYSMAIFSQEDEQTSTDFRKYNDAKPNRRVPYALPEVIKANLTNLMNKIGLNSGSIDMIVTKKKEYIFLEINPVGQFSMVARPCNYFIERDIAKYLSYGSIQK